MQTPSWVRKIFSVILSPFSWIKRVYNKYTLFSNLPEQVQTTLSNCDGHSLDLSEKLQKLTESEVEATLKYIVTYFPHLKSLSLRDNHLHKVPETIGKLPQLTTLDLSNNKLITIPESIGKLSQLKILDLPKNQLTILPESIGNLPQLKILFLYKNQLTTLPDSIGNLTQLELLSLADNKLTTLPEAIGNLPQLITLNLANNQLTTLPESIENLTRLRELYLSINKLITLPESIGKLSQLTTLPLYENQLTTLPESIGNLTQLKLLFLYKNKLTILPKAIGNLTQLELLSLADNKLTTLPESIGNLARLSNVFLSNNSLISLPIHFFSLPKELRLYIGKDQLTSLPQMSESIFADYGLNELIGYFNHIIKLPEMQQVKTLLSFTSVSKQFYHLITGKNVTSLKKTLPQKTLENTIEPASLPSEQNSQDNVVQTQSFFSMLPNEISKIILLQANGLPPSNYGAFTKLISEKPTTKSIECFLDNTTSPSSQRNWRNVVQEQNHAEQERSRT